MSLKSTHFSGISFRTCYARWCADSLVARRHFALSRFDFRSFRVSVGKMTPGRGGYQSTNLPYTNEQIPESYESVSVEIQARGVDIDADRAAVAEQIDITADDIRSERHGRMRCVGPIDHTP